MSANLCSGCGVVCYPEDPACECDSTVYRVDLTPTVAAQLSTARWIAVSLDRIGDALEELVTFKENEVRERFEKLSRGGN